MAQPERMAAAVLEKIDELRKAIVELEFTDALFIRSFGSLQHSSGMHTWPNGAITKGPTLRAMTIHITADQCNTKVDAIAFLKEELRKGKDR